MTMNITMTMTMNITMNMTMTGVQFFHQPNFFPWLVKEKDNKASQEMQHWLKVVWTKWLVFGSSIDTVESVDGLRVVSNKRVFKVCKLIFLGKDGTNPVNQIMNFK